MVSRTGLSFSHELHDAGASSPLLLSSPSPREERGEGAQILSEWRAETIASTLSLAAAAALRYLARTGETQAPRQTHAVQALCNTRSLEEIAHGRPQIFQLDLAP